MTSQSSPPNAADTRAVWSDFLALCGFGGRLAGSPGEAAAFAWLRSRFDEIPSANIREDVVDYPGWRCHAAELIDTACGTALACTPLLGTASTPPEGLTANVVDLGRGRREDFEQQRAAIPGSIVLVRHEYPFATGHMHRRVKLGLAREMGAAGFLIAHPETGVGPVSGSSGRDGGPGIPALGISAEAGTHLGRSANGRARARMTIIGEDVVAQTRVLIFDSPGASENQIVVSAHVDGHPHGESAIDNATGVAVALGVACALAPHAARARHGLRVCLFGAEEWGLAGSRFWLARMDPHERARIRLNINLDSVGGADGLTALTSGFPHLDAWVERTAKSAGLAIATHLPLMPNSDHANFAAHGVPALRLLAGFNDPDSSLRLLLTAADTRDKVKPSELEHALRSALALTSEALAAPDSVLRQLAEREPG